MLRTNSSTLGAILALTFATPLLAQTRTPAAPAGNVTRAQVEAQVKQVFDLADTNKDGFMSRAEFAKRMAAVLNRTPPGTAGAPSREQAQKMLNAADAAFNAVDTNHDGKLSRKEAGARALAAFDLMDTNHDGIVTPAEKRAARNGAVPIGPVGPNGPSDESKPRRGG